MKDNATLDRLLFRFNRYLATQLGLYFPEERRRDLQRGVAAAAHELGFRDIQGCIEALMESPLTRRQAEVLASHLTIGETYFFRDQAIFSILERQILPALVHSRRRTGRRLRIWSAACCTGEEPYSIAILLSRLIPDLKGWSITILGTDINPHFLARAAEGVYRDWSFRDTPSWIRERYFQRTREGDFQVLPRIKDMVGFAYLNLADGLYPSPLNNTAAFDLVFCRNVLMYFEPQQTRKVIENLHRALVEGGHLIVSQSETSSERFAGFTTVNVPDAILYRKDPAPASPRTSARPMIGSPLGKDIAGKFTPPFGKGGLGGIFKEAKRPKKQRQTGRYGEALEALPVALETSLADAKSMALLARTCAGQGNLAEALDWCQKSVAIDKFNAGHRYLLATILEELERVEEAASALKQALYLDPDFVLAHFALGNLALRQGRYRQANRHFENARTLLKALPAEAGLPEADGLTAARLLDIIQTTMSREIHATGRTHPAQSGHSY